MDFNFRRDINDNNCLVVTSYEGCNPSVIVPAEAYGMKVIGIDTNAFRTCNMEEIILSETIQFIRDKAFMSCFNLKRINLSNVVSIGEEVFADTQIEELNIPENCVEISEKAFINMEHLHLINVNENNESYFSLNGVLFQDTSLLQYPEGKEDEKYIIPDGVETLGAFAFYNSKCQEVKFPSTLIEIESDAFAYSEIANIMLPPNLQYVGDRCFYSCEKLTDIFFPSSVEEIGKEVCKFCVYLEGAYIGTGIYSIPSRAFENCYHLVDADISFVEEIGANAFRGCFRLENIDLSAVSIIGANAFSKCETLTEVNLIKIYKLASRAFAGCKGLKSVILPHKFYEIKDAVFKKCFSLKDINLDKVLSFGYEALDGCKEENFTFNKEAHFEIDEQ